ncbi:hypothetical protein D3C71_1768910 [compost metagenome]|jgi:hypothetical protein
MTTGEMLVTAGSDTALLKGNVTPNATPVATTEPAASNWDPSYTGARGVFPRITGRFGLYTWL